jgi:hypothetical protein
MPDNAGVNRRTFIKNAGFGALAGAAGTLTAGAPEASAQIAESATSIPRLADGKLDFDTPYNRAGSNCSRWDSPPRH